MLFYYLRWHKIRVHFVLINAIEEFNKLTSISKGPYIQNRKIDWHFSIKLILQRYIYFFLICKSHFLQKCFYCYLFIAFPIFLSKINLLRMTCSKPIKQKEFKRFIESFNCSIQFKSTTTRLNIIYSRKMVMVLISYLLKILDAYKF